MPTSRFALVSAALLSTFVAAAADASSVVSCKYGSDEYVIETGPNDQYTLRRKGADYTNPQFSSTPVETRQTLSLRGRSNIRWLRGNPTTEEPTVAVLSDPNTPGENYIYFDTTPGRTKVTAYGHTQLDSGGFNTECQVGEGMSALQKTMSVAPILDPVEAREIGEAALALSCRPHGEKPWTTTYWVNASIQEASKKLTVIIKDPKADHGVVAYLENFSNTGTSIIGTAGAAKLFPAPTADSIEIAKTANLVGGESIRAAKLHLKTGTILELDCGDRVAVGNLSGVTAAPKAPESAKKLPPPGTLAGVRPESFGSIEQGEKIMDEAEKIAALYAPLIQKIAPHATVYGMWTKAAHHPMKQDGGFIEIDVETKAQADAVRAKVGKSLGGFVVQYQVTGETRAQ